MSDDLAFNHVHAELSDKGGLVPIVYTHDRLDMAGTDVCVAECSLYLGRMNIDYRRIARVILSAHPLDASQFSGYTPPTHAWEQV